MTIKLKSLIAHNCGVYGEVEIVELIKENNFKHDILATFNTNFDLLKTGIIVCGLDSNPIKFMTIFKPSIQPRYINLKLKFQLRKF